MLPASVAPEVTRPLADAIMRAGARVWIVRETSLDVFEAEFNAWVALCS